MWPVDNCSRCYWPNQWLLLLHSFWHTVVHHQSICTNKLILLKQCKHKSFFLRLEFFWGIQGMPSESWHPGLSENVVVFVAIIFWTRIMAGWSWVKFQRKKIVEWNRTKKRHGYNFAFQASILNQRLPNRYVLMLIQWQNLKRKIVAVSFFCTVSYFC